MQGTMPGARRRGRPCTAWVDNIKTWTGLSVEESVRMTEDRDKWRMYVHGVASPRMEDGQQQNRTDQTQLHHHNTTDSTDSPDCLLILLSIYVSYFSVFLFSTF